MPAFPADRLHRRTGVAIVLSGGPMPHYVSLHTLACMTRQGAEQLATRMASASDIIVRSVQVNLVEGKMLVEFEAANRETLEAWLKSEGFHYEWLMRIELSFHEGKLTPVP
jgi:hypothetical protein